mmetsp:Transcript_104103/g.127176  ORF Transcript_104103/g.127176 Transcript_104103/m.127176 type:complete len:147 (+) Transcript_104103:70-510(+)
MTTWTFDDTKMDAPIINEPKMYSNGITENDLESAGVTKDGCDAVMKIQNDNYIFRHKIVGRTRNKRTYKNANIFEPNWYITIALPDDNKKFWNTLNGLCDDNVLKIKNIHETAKQFQYKLSIAWVEGFVGFNLKRIFFIYDITNKK